MFVIYVYAKFHICNGHQTERQKGESRGRQALSYILQIYCLSKCFVFPSVYYHIVF
jgi:hypothetical protein